ncbi:MAG: bifunctional hydroxymethylpyrimidine kinase/phosphomethylpyrimidine kinase [Bacteroidales bacterium]|nr:bifunctional hydroxymethylpyrimidine kinase/phosphomethylpyrimidine kinase [Bacteroidales bacterium]
MQSPNKKVAAVHDLSGFGRASLTQVIPILSRMSMQVCPLPTAVIAYDRSDDRYWKVTVNYIPASYPGTGDAFASVITGAWLQGDSLPIALDRAVKFTSMGVKATFGYDYDANHGILLERILHTLDAPFQGISYELI